MKQKWKVPSRLVIINNFMRKKKKGSRLSCLVREASGSGFWNAVFLNLIRSRPIASLQNRITKLTWIYGSATMALCGTVGQLMGKFIKPD